MLDTLFITVNQWMAQGAVVAMTGAFLWGMV
ncbi:MAG: cytochrome C biosynthesis protein, partial [Desulfobacterales bacterium CG23_combo_of_CG06-09_8_20_14_all_52_9]